VIEFTPVLDADGTEIDPRRLGYNDTIGKDRRKVAIAGFACLVKTYYGAIPMTFISEAMESWIDDDETYMVVGDRKVLKKFTKDKTLWIAHEPVTYERLFVQLPLHENPEQWFPHARVVSAPIIDVTNMKPVLVDCIAWAADQGYRKHFGRVSRENPDLEERTVNENMDRFLQVDQTLFPGEEADG
jgi:hypothetical protein